MMIVSKNEFAVKRHSKSDVTFPNFFFFVAFFSYVFAAEMCILFQVVLDFSPFFTKFTLGPILNFIVFAFVADFCWAQLWVLFDFLREDGLDSLYFLKFNFFLLGLLFSVSLHNSGREQLELFGFRKLWI